MIAALILVLIAKAPTPPRPEEAVSPHEAELAKMLAAKPLADLLGAPRSKEPSLEVCRKEAAFAAPFKELLQRWNAEPAPQPYVFGSLLTLNSEGKPHRQLIRLVDDMAYLSAVEGRSHEASDWLHDGQRFALRLSVDGYLAALFRRHLLSDLRTTGMRILQKLTPVEIDRQIAIGQEISNHEIDMERAAKLDKQAFDAAVADFVVRPSDLGLPDSVDVAKAVPAYVDAMMKMTPAEQQILRDVQAKNSKLEEDDFQGLYHAILDYGTSIDPKDRTAYNGLVKIMAPALNPPVLKTEEFAKTMTDADRIHAVSLIHEYCDGPYLDSIAAFDQPIRLWGLPWKSVQALQDNHTVIADGKAQKFVKVDFFATHIIEGIQMFVADIDFTRQRRAALIEREKDQLYVVHALVEKYRQIHGSLPEVLRLAGASVDSITGLPFDYRRRGTTYTLGAKGLPGMAAIDMDTTLPAPKPG